MHQRSHSPIAGLSTRRCLPRCSLFIVLTALIAGSVAVPGLAATDVRVPITEQWEKHPTFKPFNISDRELPPRLFLVRTDGEPPEADGIIIHGMRDGAYLVSGSIFALRGLSLHGCSVTPVAEMPEAPPPLDFDVTPDLPPLDLEETTEE